MRAKVWVGVGVLALVLVAGSLLSLRPQQQPATVAPTATPAVDERATTIAYVTAQVAKLQTSGARAKP